MIIGQGEGPIEAVELRGIESARPTPEALEALRRARAIVIGPSNPVLSIGPILAVPGMREAVVSADAPVVAVSPFVQGRVLKGPTEPFMSWAGQPLSSDGIAATYDGIIDGLLADEPTKRVACRQADVLMSDAAARRRVAAQALEFAEVLAS
jgi:LPPG:FO 2-phospho-L-lactate transferase